MKKVLAKGLALAFVGSLFMAGSAMALSYTESYVGSVEYVPGVYGQVVNAGQTYEFLFDFELGNFDLESPTNSNLTLVGDVTGVFGPFTSAIIDANFWSGDVAQESTTIDLTLYAVGRNNYQAQVGSFEWNNSDGLFHYEFTVDQLGSFNNESWAWVGISANYLDGNVNGNFVIGDVSMTVSDTAPVPEPATMLLFGTGIAGLAGYGRRRAKKNK